MKQEISNRERFVELDQIMVKIIPDNVGCCHEHRFPETWKTVCNLQDFHKVDREFHKIALNYKDTLTIEEHEHGPEIWLMVSKAADIATLLWTIKDYIALFIDGFKKESKFNIPKNTIKYTYKEKTKNKEISHIIEIQSSDKIDAMFCEGVKTFVKLISKK